MQANAFIEQTLTNIGLCVLKYQGRIDGIMLWALLLGFKRFHVLAEEPGEMAPVRWVGGAIRNLNLNNTIIFGLVVGSEDTIDVLALLEIVIVREGLAVGRMGTMTVAACEAIVRRLRKVCMLSHPFNVDDFLTEGLVESLVARN